MRDHVGRAWAFGRSTNGYMIGVDAFVTDSSGRGAVGGTWVFCP